MIPKKIHYCWFGYNPLPESAKKCIESWKKFFPDYEIIEWNESNFDVRACQYTSEAYDSKKYAFVSDYARFEILYKNGGIYFDTDVEIIKSFDDILKYDTVMGVEKVDKNGDLFVNPGLGFFSIANTRFFQEVLQEYATRRFINDDGTYNLCTVVEYTSNLLKKYGMRKINGIQVFENICILPTDYLCPLCYDTGKLKITSNTVSIHHFTGSWLSEEQRYFHSNEQKFKRILGKKFASYAARVCTVVKYYGMKGLIAGINKKIVNKIKKGKND